MQERDLRHFLYQIIPKVQTFWKIYRRTGPSSSSPSNIHRCSKGTRSSCWARTWRTELSGLEFRVIAVWVWRKEDFENGSGKPATSDFLGMPLLLVAPLLRVECKEKVAVEEEAQSIAIVALALFQLGNFCSWLWIRLCLSVNTKIRNRGKG